MADETVTQRLEFDASQAIKALKEVQETADTVAGKANILNKHLQDYSRTLGQSWKQTLAQMREIGAEKFGGFSTQTMVNGQVVNKDVTDEVFRQTEALAKAAQAKNKFVTEDTNAARAEMNFDGSVKQANAAILEQAKRIQVLVGELNKLKNPTQGRNALGQFATAAPPSFATQFAGLSTYQEQLKLVESTIASLQKKTNLPFKDIGRELGKSFPELLKDTNLVAVAVENLTKKNQGLSASFVTESEKMRLVEQELTRLQKAGKINLTGSNQQVVNNLKGVIKEVSSTTGAQFKDVANQLEQMGVPAAQAQAAVRGLNHEMTRGTKEASGFHKGINLLRTALGTLAAVGIFSFLSALQGAFTKIIGNLKETELAVYNLINAERRLSQQGIDVTPKGLQEIIDGVQKLVPVLTQIQSEELVSRIATNVAPALHLTSEQIKQMAEATALLYVRNKALGKSFDEVEGQLTNAFLTGKVSTGINQLGVKISDQIVKDEALRLGLVKTEDQFNSLTGEMEAQVKAAAMLSIVYKNATEDSQSLGNYMETVDAQSNVLSKTWSDLLTHFGKLAAPAILEILKTAIIQLQAMNDWLTRNEDTIRRIVAVLAGVARVNREINEEASKDDSWGSKLLKLVPALSVIQRMHNLSPKAKLDTFMEGYDEALNKVEELKDAADTPTAPIDLTVNANTDDLDELDKKLEEIAIDAQHAKEDLDILLAQKQEDLEIKVQLKTEDINTEYQQKGEDAARDYAQKIEDINLDAQQKIEDAKRKAREDEEKAEAEFLLRMKELREDFLMDLEDALHERDARQVLRLIKEYNLDKQKLIDKKALDDQFRKQALDADLKNIEIERQRKLESAAIEYQRKLEQLAVAKQRELEELAIWKQREEEELQKWYQREQEEIDRNTKNKIERLLAGYIEEGKIHEESQGKIHEILNKWFGKNKGLVDELVNYTALRFSEMAAQVAAVMGAMSSMMSFGGFGGPRVSGPANSLQTTTSLGTYVGGLAKGGQFVATKPTTATFGEGGEPELVTITPLSKLGSMQNKQPLNGVNGLDGRNGQQTIALEMNLSPDLEARVVQKSMDGTANVIQRINRSKG